MTNTNLLDTKTVSLNELLGNGKIYKVPPFQRDYSWDQDNWEDLWSDIENAEKGKSLHYMGSVVLKSTTAKDYLIIDGQQRFSTLSILTLAIIDAIDQLSKSGVDPVENEERKDLLMRQYIGHKDPSSLTYTSKLFLNENNDGFYQQRLVSFKEPINVNKLSDSEKLLWRAYQFFKDKIATKFLHATGGDLASFLNNTIGELMMFIQITVQDELDAYTVFETLNSRGVELTSTDLLKNYLFSLVAKSDTDLMQVRSQWKRIIDAIGLKDFPTYLRFYIMATRRQITKDSLFREVKFFIKDNQDVFEALDKLETYAYHYLALSSPDDDLWSQDRELRTAITILRAFKVTQWKPLMMEALQVLPSADSKRLLNAIVAISYRYNVIAKMQTNEMEKVYSNAAIALHKNPNQNIATTIAHLKELYVDDNDFKHLFSIKSFNTKNQIDKKLLRYTLYQLEAKEHGGSLYDFENDNGTIEHILPESYPERWQETFSEEAFEKYVYRIGNLTLLEASKNNKQAANKLFDDKKPIYEKSKYAITSTIEDVEWTPQRIDHRQAHLAKLAAGIWKIQF